MYIFLAITGYLFLALVFILDKFIVSGTKLRPLIYTFYSTIFMLAFLFVVPFGVEYLRPADWGWAILSGVSFGSALYFFYLSLVHGETTHLAPFNGAVIAVSIYFLAIVVLGDRLSAFQSYGLLILILASFLFSFERSRTNKGVHIGFLWAGVSGVLFALSHVSAKYLYLNYDFLTAFVWSRAFIGLVGLVLLFTPTIWKSVVKILISSFKFLMNFFRKLVENSKRPTIVKPLNSRKTKKHTLSVVITDKILGALAMILIQLAAALGSVTIVFALAGLQFVFLFILIILLTKFTPKLFKEYFTRTEVIIQSIAILLVVAGSVMLVL